MSKAPAPHTLDKAAKPAPAPGLTEITPCTPFNAMLREYTPSTTVSILTTARADKKPNIADQS